jgi:hypothetical protein
MDVIEGGSLYDSSLRTATSTLEFATSGKPPLEKIVFFIFHNPVYFIKVASLKVWYLVSGIRPYYSSIHNVFTVVWMAAIYILFGLGWQRTHHAIKVFAIVVILVNCALIGVSTVDWDNRFYIPMEPGIVLLSGGGGAYLINFTRRKKQESTVV